MVVALRVKGSDYGHVVDAGRERGIQLRDFDARAPILLELVRACHQSAGISEKDLNFPLPGHWFSMVPRQLGLRIEKVDMTGSAIHKQEDHRGRLWREMRTPGGERVAPGGRIGRLRGQEAVAVEEMSKCKTRESGARVENQLPASQRTRVQYREKIFFSLHRQTRSS